MSRNAPLLRWLVSSFVLSGTLFLCTGRTHAPMITAYVAVFAGTGLVTAVLTDPSQDRERRMPGPQEIHSNSRRAATVLFLVTVVVAALDAGRFHWTTLSRPIQIVALAVLILAGGLQVWAMTANPFFSTAIRIQAERSHKLITRGPYRFIRHPGYLAMAVIMPATALALGSTLALVPALIYSAVILFRLQREDGFLSENLGPYAEYAKSVRHRLIPGRW